MGMTKGQGWVAGCVMRSLGGERFTSRRMQGDRAHQSGQRLNGAGMRHGSVHADTWPGYGVCVSDFASSRPRSPSAAIVPAELGFPLRMASNATPIKAPRMGPTI